MSPLCRLLATTAAQRLARRVSERGGGLPFVQAMALQHAGPGHGAPQDAAAPDPLANTAPAGTMEIACNLLNTNVTPPAAVQLEVERLVAREEALAREAAAEAAAGGGGPAAAEARRGRITVLPGYCTGRPAQELVDMALALGGGRQAAA